MSESNKIRDIVKTMPRPSTDAYFLLMSQMVASRATCPRRRVGCVFVDSRGHVLCTGYNGVASGEVHCTDTPCPGAGMASGQGLNLCQALHAEENALIQLRDPELLHTVYVTASPCILCTRRLLNTMCHRIVYIDEYPHPEAKMLWESRGRIWQKGEL